MTLDCQNKTMLDKYYKKLQSKKENKKSPRITAIFDNRRSLVLHITIQLLQGVHRDVRELTKWPRASTIEIKIPKPSIVNTVKMYNTIGHLQVYNGNK